MRGRPLPPNAVRWVTGSAAHSGPAHLPAEKAPDMRGLVTLIWRDRRPWGARLIRVWLTSRPRKLLIRGFGHPDLARSPSLYSRFPSLLMRRTGKSLPPA